MKVSNVKPQEFVYRCKTKLKKTYHLSLVLLVA